MINQNAPPVAQSLVDAEAVLESIEACVEEREYDSALRIGERYLSKIDNDSAQAAFEKFKVRTKIADVMYRLKSFDHCLEQYELCRALAEKYVGVESNEAMEIIFKIERTLSAMAMLEKIGTAEAELKQTLVSQYLLQTEHAGGKKADHSDKIEKVVDAKVEAELLENLWSDALDKQKELDEDLKKRPKEKPQWLQAAEEFANRREVQIFQFQLMICGSVLLLLLGLYQGVTYVMKYGWGSPAQYHAADAEGRFKDARRAAKSFEKLDIKSWDGQEKLTFKPNETAILTIGKNQLKGKLLFYDDSIPSKIMTIICSNLSPNAVFQCRGCSIVSPNGAVFFDSAATDFKLVKEIENLARKLNSTQIDSSTLSASSDLLTYVNPSTMKPQKVVLSDKMTGNSDTKPGSILLQVVPDKPRDYHLVGFYSKGRSFAAERERAGWKSLFPVTSSQNLDFNKENLFIMCGQEIDVTTNYLRTNLMASFVLLAVTAVGALVLLVQIKAKGAQINVRTKGRLS